MQKAIKTNLTSEGKMLSGYVNKYLRERTTFDPSICQYSFGLDEKPTKGNASAYQSVPGDERNTFSSSIKFPMSARRTTADKTAAGDTEKMTASIGERGFGLNLNSNMGMTLEANNGRSGSIPNGTSSAFADGKNSFTCEKLKVATAQPMSRRQMQQEKETKIISGKQSLDYHDANKQRHVMQLTVTTSSHDPYGERKANMKLQSRSGLDFRNNALDQKGRYLA